MNKINFVNNSAPDLDATTLNQLQTNIENEINRIGNKKYVIELGRNSFSTVKYFHLASINYLSDNSSRAEYIKISGVIGGYIADAKISFDMTFANRTSTKVYGWRDSNNNVVPTQGDIIISKNSNNYYDVLLKRNGSSGPCNLTIELSEYATIGNLEEKELETQIFSLSDLSPIKTYITTGTEIVTNEYIDGKQVYKKRINFGTLPNANTKSFNTGISSNSKLEKINGNASNGTTELAIPSKKIDFNKQGSWINLITTEDLSSYTAYVDLYYTKN